jgi:hypothetical protein
LRADKESIERKLHDAEVQLKGIDDAHRQAALSCVTKSRLSSNDDDDDDDNSNNNNNNNNGDIFYSKHGLGNKRNAADDRLTDTDSDMIEMQETLKQLRQTQMEYMSIRAVDPINDNMFKNAVQTNQIDTTKLSVADVGSFIRNIRAAHPRTTRIYNSFDSLSQQQFNDTIQTLPRMISTLSNDTFVLPLSSTLNRRHSQDLSKTHQWNPTSSLVTREAVIKAARTVFAPGVIDKLTSNARSSSY